MDHHISAKQRFYVRVNATRNYRVQDQRHSDTVGHILFRYNRGAAIDHVYTVSPSFLINSRYSYTRYIDGNYPDQDGWDLAGLGFSSNFRQSDQRSRSARFAVSADRRDAATPLYPCRPGTRIRSTRTTSP